MALDNNSEGISWGYAEVVAWEMVMGMLTWKLAADADIWRQKLPSSNSKSPSQKPAW